MNPKVEGLVAERCAAQGTPQEADAAAPCSSGLLAEYKKWVLQTRDKFKKLPRMAKHWWKTSRELTQRRSNTSNSPTLVSAEEKTIRDPVEKAQAFADHCSSRFAVPEVEENEYSSVAMEERPQEELLSPGLKLCEQ